jgi:membrane-bound lytic murein transglycosylase D
LKSYFIIPLLGAAILLSSCEEKKKTAAVPPAHAQAPTIAQVDGANTPQIEEKITAKTDPVEDLIKRAEAEYTAGQANYAAGHLEAAKENFDRAFDLMVQSPLDVRADDRLQNEFDKLVDGINGLELVALKEGDGFTEQRSEPAPIDEANEVTFPIDPNLKAKAAEELKSTTSDLPLVLNDAVASYINYFSNGGGRGFLERGYVRSGKYRNMILRTLKAEGVPQDLIYLAQAESGFHPLALSKVGARGMWQFMASRGSGYGLERNWWVDDRQDPEKATRAAAHHLKDLYKQFGDWYLAMAAYNSGPGNVQKAVQRTGYADFWELYKRNVLPAETKNYVPIILAITIMSKNPAQYGLDRLRPDASADFDTVTIDHPVDLRLVSECVDTSVATLQDLNPSLLRLTTPKDQTFELRVPAGTKEKFQTAIAAIPPDMRVWWRYHKVSTGDTLVSVAKRYHVSAEAIAKANDLDEDEALSQQAKLVIPISPGRRGEGETMAFARKATRYEIRKGDTVLSVADDFGVPVQTLRKWNHLRGTRLRPGHTLLIHRPIASPDVTEQASMSYSHTGKGHLARVSARNTGTTHGKKTGQHAKVTAKSRPHSGHKAEGAVATKSHKKKSSVDDDAKVSRKRKKVAG